MAKAKAIIDQALKKIGVLATGETARGDDANDRLKDLNVLLDSFPLDEFKQYAEVEVVVSVPSNTASMTIGPGQQINVARPVAIQGGGFFRSGSTDYPFDVATREQYAAISTKNIGAHSPDLVYYQPGAATGVLFFFPVPAGQLELHLPLQVLLTPFADLTTDYTLPSGYERYLVYALARECAAVYERAIPPDVERIYQGLSRSLKRTNFTMPLLSMKDARDANTSCYDVIGNRYIGN